MNIYMRDGFSLPLFCLISFNIFPVALLGTASGASHLSMVRPVLRPVGLTQHLLPVSGAWTATTQPGLFPRLQQCSPASSHGCMLSAWVRGSLERNFTILRTSLNSRQSLGKDCGKERAFGDCKCVAVVACGLLQRACQKNA